MGIETGDLISDLNPAWPTGGEDVKEGDDHLRHLKHVLQFTFSDTATSFSIHKGSATLTFNDDGTVTANGELLGGNAIVSDTEPVGTFTQGRLWWQPSTGDMYVWYDDGISPRWAIVGHPAVTVGEPVGILMGITKAA